MLLFVAALVVGAMAPQALAAPKVFAATGLSTESDVMAAAEEATRAMMARFQAASRKPGAVIFLERVANPGGFAAKAGQIGGRVKELAGGVPTFGHGGVDTYGVVLGPDVKDGQSTFLVLGIDAPSLDVRGYAVGGQIQYDYVSERPRPEEPAAARKWEQGVLREIQRRDAARQRGRDLGEMIPPLRQGGFILLLGALHNNWHVTFLDGLREKVDPRVPMLGGVGRWQDYVYNDGQGLTDTAGRPTSVGQLAIVVQGQMKVALVGARAADTSRLAAVQAMIADVAGESRQKLGQNPAAAVAFSCVTLLRNTKVMDSGVFHAALAQAYGADTPIVGAFCGGELGIDSAGAFSAGGDRFMVLLLGEP